MAREDKADRLKSYLEMITRKSGGPEAHLRKLKKTGAAADRPKEGAGPAGLEMMQTGPSAQTGPSNLDQAQSAVEKLAIDRTPSVEEMGGLEAIINEDLRPAVFVQDGT